MEKKSLKANVRKIKTKVMWCKMSKGQAEDSGESPCGVWRKELVTIQSYTWSVLGGFIRDVVPNQESWRIYNSSWFPLQEICLEGNHALIMFAERGYDWIQCEIGMCSQVLLLVRHTWCRRRCGGGSESLQSEMCLGWVQGGISSILAARVI